MTNEELEEQLNNLKEELEEVKSNQVDKNDVLDSFKRLVEAEDMIESGSSAPTYAPKTFLEQFYLYDDTTNQRLYIYQDGTWRYIALTT